jgi:hypothetical protein
MKKYNQIKTDYKSSVKKTNKELEKVYEKWISNQQYRSQKWNKTIPLLNI